MKIRLIILVARRRVNFGRAAPKSCGLHTNAKRNIPDPAYLRYLSRVWNITRYLYAGRPWRPGSVARSGHKTTPNNNLVELLGTYAIGIRRPPLQSEGRATSGKRRLDERHRS